MHVVGHITLGPQWKQGKSVTQQGRPMEGHLRYMRDLYERGVLTLGGPYTSIDGGLAVFDVAHLEEAQHLADGDPASEADVIEYRLEVLTPVFETATNTNRYRKMAGLMAVENGAS